MSRITRNMRLAVAFVIVFLMIGAAAGRAMHLVHDHSVHVRALAVDNASSMFALTLSAVSVFVLPIPQTRRFVSFGPTSSQYESLSVAQPATRPPPSFA
jgi:cytochrome c biogenesis protein CcdA